jgi:hypothetical protein
MREIPPKRFKEIFKAAEAYCLFCKRERVSTPNAEKVVNEPIKPIEISEYKCFCGEESERPISIPARKQPDKLMTKVMRGKCVGAILLPKR